MAWQHFKKEEFACYCCGHNAIDETLIDMLDEARELAGVPFKINSGFRCKLNNSSTPGSSPVSAHMKGKAADISCTDSHTRYLMLKALFEVGFKRIEPRETWIHVDIDETKPQEVVFFK